MFGLADDIKQPSENNKKDIKCEIQVIRITFPKGKDSVQTQQFAIFKAIVTKPIENCEANQLLNIKGVVASLDLTNKYNIHIKFDKSHEIFGDTYNLVFINQKISLNTINEQKIFMFSIFPNKNVVESLFETYKEDVISLLENKDIDALTQIKGIGEQTAQKMITKFYQTKDYSKAFIELNKYELTQSLILKLCDFYGSPETLLSTLENNIYDIIEVDQIGFKKADEIALKMGMTEDDERRLNAFIVYTLTKEAEMGRSFLHLKNLLEALYNTLGYIENNILDEIFNMMIENEEVVVFVINDNDERIIALTKYYNLEQKLERELKRLVNARNISNKKTIPNWEDIIIESELEQGFEFTDEQKYAIESILGENVIAITGGSGTGKTSTAKGIFQLFKDKKVMAVALAGKAAIRITETTGVEASTIHRALCFDRRGFLFNKNNKLDIDVVLLDEATMTNGTLFLALMEAIPDSAKFIIMGDVQQLTSIGNCQVFNDILNSSYIKTVFLTQIHRQAMKSGIIPLARRVSDQEQIFDSDYNKCEVLGELQDMLIDIYTDETDLSDVVVHRFLDEVDRTKVFMEVQVLVCMKSRGNLSAYNINNKIQAILNPLKEDEPFIEIPLSKKDADYKCYKLHLFDKVINTKNNYNAMNMNEKVCPVFNGNLGIISFLGEDFCIVTFVGLGEIKLTLEECKNLELAYAITVHKSQGSEFDTTIMALDSSSYIMNTSELLYTGLTRAKKFGMLVAENKAVKNSIKRKETKTKQTFLRIFLESKYGKKQT